MRNKDEAINNLHKTTFSIIDTIGRVVSFLIFALIAILLFGVIMRYVFNSPSTWASELSSMLYACYFLLGGSFALLHNHHVNVNILRERFSEKTRATIDLVTWLFFYIYIGVIFYLGIGYAYDSVMKLETSSTAWGPYIWPVKVLLPLSALLMLLAGILKTLRDIKILLK